MGLKPTENEREQSGPGGSPQNYKINRVKSDDYNSKNMTGCVATKDLSL